jgi:MoxR-like ATPase
MRSAVLHSHSMPLSEPPRPALKYLFGRDELVEKLVKYANDLKPIALIGAPGIGKTSIALALLHHSSIIERFGENRRFIQCIELSTATRAVFLS